MTQLTQKEIETENLNSRTVMKETGIIISNDPTKKAQDSDGFTGEYYYRCTEK